MHTERKKEKQTRSLPATRCTEAEYEAIVKNSKAAGLTISAYIRQTAQGGQITIRKSKYDPALVFQLRKLAVNLNQQTKKLHQTGQVPYELKGLWLKVSELIDQIVSK